MLGEGRREAKNHLVDNTRGKKRKERPIKRKSVKRWLSINTRESLMKRHSSHTENDPKYPQRQGIMKNQRAKQR